MRALNKMARYKMQIRLIALLPHRVCRELPSANPDQYIDKSSRNFNCHIPRERVELQQRINTQLPRNIIISSGNSII